MTQITPEPGLLLMNERAVPDFKVSFTPRNNAAFTAERRDSLRVKIHPPGGRMNLE